MTVQERLADTVRRAVENGEMVDVHDEAITLFRPLLEDAVEHAVNQVDMDYLADPNTVLHNEYPTVSRDKGSTTGNISYEDIHARNPYGEQAKEALQDATVGFIGYGGVQLVSENLVRDGVGSLVIADHDRFESTNANRQTFCDDSSLGQNKASEGADRLVRMNDDLDVQVVEERIQPDDVGNVYDDCDIIIDGSGDLSIRDAIHRYRQRSGTPTVSWAWAGFEGQYVVMEEEDPLYTEAFSYSPYTDDRGFLCGGLNLLNSMMAIDTEKYLLGDDSYASYPLFTTVNQRRRNLVNIRDVSRVRAENAS